MPNVDKSIVSIVAAVVVGGVGTYVALTSRGARQSKDAPSKDDKMKKLFLVKPDLDPNKMKFAIQEVEIPQPGPGEVLVRMSAAPVNPSDYGSWMTAKPEEGPKTIGFEGSGVVVASGGGFMANRLVGQTVGVVSFDVGTYSEYVCVNATTGTFPIRGYNVKPEDAASSFVNPFTALAILDTAAARGSKAFIHTAAASQLGQMMVKVGPSMGMTVVNVVRRQEQVELLRGLGAEYAVNTSDKDWKEQLSALIEKLDIKVAFDAIAGSMSGEIVELLPHKGTCFVYGGLSKEPVSSIDTMKLIYGGRSVEGFVLTHWIYAGGPLQSIRRLRKASATVNAGLVKGGWAESEFVDCRLEDMQPKFLEMWNTVGFTGKKLRIRMD